MKKIFRFAIVCAVAGAALLTGCTKDFTSDIDKLKEDVSNLDKKIDEKFGDLQDQIKAGALITDVQKVAEGIKITLSNGKSYLVENGAAGKDATVWTIGADGFWYQDGKKTDKKAVGTDAPVWTIGADGYWYQDGKKTDKKATGADAPVWTIGADGYWYKDGVKQDQKAVGEPGEKGDTGNYWKPDVENNKWVEYDSKNVATGNEMTPLFAEGGAVTAVWDKDKGVLELANVKDIEGPVKIDLNTYLKSLAFVPARIFDGLGLITVYQANYSDVAIGKDFPFLTPATEKTPGKFLATAPIEVTYRFNPQNVDPAKYDFSFINRKVYTKATADNNDLVTILNENSQPVKSNGLFDFTIKLNKDVEPADHAKDNDIVALKAVAKDASLVAEGFENIVSDYSYIEKDVNYGYHIIHKDGYKASDPKYYRWEAYVEIGDPTDYNAGAGITTPAPGTGTNPASIALPYDGSIDLLDYVETYADQKKDLASTLGITPEYSFQFAGKKDGGTNVLIGTNPDSVPYLAADVDKTNQNKFLKFDADGHTIRVNDAFVSLLSPAIGRTPLIYVRSSYDGKPLAECLIKIEITTEPAGDEPVKGWDIFIWHDATFKFDKLTATATYTGEEGTVTAPRIPVGPNPNKDLNVTWDEVNPWVLNDVDVNMSYEDFGVKYDLSNPKLILAQDSADPTKGVEPTDLPEKDKAILVDPGDINTYYSKATGLTLTSQSPSNWKQSTNIVDLKIDNTFEALNDYTVHNVYVLYPAKDNTKNIDVIVKFSFTIKPHEHDFTILKKYNDKTYWILNPDYIQGTQDLLIEPKPAADAYYGTEPYVTYGAVKVKGLETDLRSAFVEHFKEYAKCWQSANEKSDYTLKIVNYKNDIVDIVEGGTTTNTGVDADGYAYVTIHGADLIKMGKGEATSPDILVKKPAGLNVGQDILVEVKEQCTDITDGPSVFGYYYVLFEAIKPTIKFNEVKLGDFKDQNDYAYVTEIVKGVYESDAADAVALFEWDATAGAWKLGPSAGTYGIKDASKISFKINKLIYGKNEKDTEDSFKGRLTAFEKDDPLTPWPTTGKASDAGIDWRNDGTNLEQDKVAGFELEVFYDTESLTKGEGEVTVMKTGSKAHPNHHDDDTIWE